MNFFIAHSISGRGFKLAAGDHANFIPPNGFVQVRHGNDVVRTRKGACCQKLGNLNSHSPFWDAVWEVFFLVDFQRLFLFSFVTATLLDIVNIIIVIFPVLCFLVCCFLVRCFLVRLLLRFQRRLS